MDVEGRAELEAQMALSVQERRVEVVKDLRRRVSLFCAIEAHDLAEAVEVPAHLETGEEWTFTRYAELVSVEVNARDNALASEVVCLIEGAVSARRFLELVKLSQPLDDADDPSFALLTNRERANLERAISEAQLEANESNGMNCMNCMNCIARHSVETDSGGVLEFEADIEDDGSCINLRTPYDKRAKRFADLSRCEISDEWLAASLYHPGFSGHSVA